MSKLDNKKYNAELRKLQVELVNIQAWVKQERLKVVVIFEGRDAAGKGGAIKRIIEPALPPLTDDSFSDIYEEDGPYPELETILKYIPDTAENSNLYFTGTAVDEKLSFTIQMDYSSKDPLVEAFIGYHISENMTLYIGQMQVHHNNLEMTQNQEQLRFTNRGLTSQIFTENGEEFGLFFFVVS